MKYFQTIGFKGDTNQKSSGGFAKGIKSIKNKLIGGGPSKQVVLKEF